MNIEELKQLAEDATPGPWIKRGYALGIGCGVDGVTAVAHHTTSADADFIAAANPAAVLELIDYAQGLESTLQDAADGLKKAQDGEIAALRQRDEARQNDIHAMSWLADCRFAVGDDGKRMLPEFVEYLRDLKQQRDELLAALKVFADKYNSAPDGDLGIGLVNGDFFRAIDVINKSEAP